MFEWVQAAQRDNKKHSRIISVADKNIPGQVPWRAHRLIVFQWEQSDHVQEPSVQLRYQLKDVHLEAGWSQWKHQERFGDENRQALRLKLKFLRVAVQGNLWACEDWLWWQTLHWESDKIVYSIWTQKLQVKHRSRDDGNSSVKSILISG